MVLRSQIAERRGVIRGMGGVEVLSNLIKNIGLTHEQFPGEQHLKMGNDEYNYLGPKTRLDIRLDPKTDPKYRVPINQLDQSAKTHDIQYSKINKDLKENKITDKEAIKRIHMSDDEFIKDLEKQHGNPIAKTMARKAIQVKKKLETLNVLDPTKFSLSKNEPSFILGSGLLPPNYYLEREVEGRVHGGLAPLAIALISSAAPWVLEKMYDFVSKKIKGSGIERQIQGSGLVLKDDEDDDAKKRKIIARWMDTQTIPEQVNILKKFV